VEESSSVTSSSASADISSSFSENEISENSIASSAESLQCYCESKPEYRVQSQWINEKLKKYEMDSLYNNVDICESEDSTENLKRKITKNPESCDSFEPTETESGFTGGSTTPCESKLREKMKS
ncbi:hypothetical protein HK100_010884, partial [Physocladia obscura]